MEQFILGGLVVVAVVALFALRLRDNRRLARTLAQEVEQRKADEAARKAKDAAARVHRLRLTKLEMGARIECLDKRYEVITCNAVIDPQLPYQFAHIRYLLSDEAGDTRWLTVWRTPELEYHSVSLWREAPFSDPYPTGEG